MSEDPVAFVIMGMFHKSDISSLSLNLGLGLGLDVVI